jgi:hypothetical protein
MEEEITPIYTDVASQRAHVVLELARYVDHIEDNDARDIMLDMMTRLTETIIPPPKPKAELIVYPGGKQGE